MKSFTKIIVIIIIINKNKCLKGINIVIFFINLLSSPVILLEIIYFNFSN